MPLKTHKATKKHPRHYAKVYWPYIPLLLIVGAGLWLGQSSAAKSQKGVLAYATSVSSKALLDATNEQRTTNGQKALVVNPKLSAAAQQKAADMVKRNYWSHTTPDGKQPWDFIDATNYDYQKAGENLAYGFATSKDTVIGWMNSPSHRENLLDSSYQEVGFGIANAPNYQNGGPETIVVAMYGNPLTPVAAPASNPPAASAPQSKVTLTDKPVTTSNQVISEPAVKSISRAQTITRGKAPWVSFAIGIVIGASIVYLVIKHGLGVRRAIKNSERFVLRHPVLDLTVLALIALCTLLSQSAGVIR